MRFNLDEARPGDRLRVSGGIVTVVRRIKRHGIDGLDCLREHSGNYYLDRDGRPREAPAMYTEHYPAWLIQGKVEDHETQR